MGRSIEAGSVSSSSRCGFGGRLTVMMKSANASMSSGVSAAPRPSSDTKAPLKDWKSGRSPRQWKGSMPASPRRVWVIMGPFIGSNPSLLLCTGSKMTQGASS